MMEEGKPAGRGTRRATGETQPAAKTAAGTATAKTTVKAKTKVAANAVEAPARAPAKTAAAKPTAAAPAAPSPAERFRMIEMAAYFRAERRGFTPGNELDDWAVAEAEVDEWLRGQAPKSAPPARKKASKPDG